MLNVIKQHVEAFGASCQEFAIQAKDEVVHHATWAGRQVEQLAHDHLPETAAKVVSTIIWALPYTVASLIAPSILFDIGSGLAIGLWNICPREIDEKIGKETRQNLYAGIRNAAIIRTGIEVVKMGITGNWFLLLPIISNIFLALQSNQIIGQDTPEQRFGEAAPQPV